MRKEKELDVRFEKLKLLCPRCKNQWEEIVVVSRNVGVLDVSCPECKKRILELKIFD